MFKIVDFDLYEVINPQTAEVSERWKSTVSGPDGVFLATILGTDAEIREAAQKAGNKNAFIATMMPRKGERGWYVVLGQAVAKKAASGLFATEPTTTTNPAGHVDVPVTAKKD